MFAPNLLRLIVPDRARVSGVEQVWQNNSAKSGKLRGKVTATKIKVQLNPIQKVVAEQLYRVHYKLCILKQNWNDIIAIGGMWWEHNKYKYREGWCRSEKLYDQQNMLQNTGSQSKIISSKTLQMLLEWRLSFIGRVKPESREEKSYVAEEMGALGMWKRNSEI